MTLSESQILSLAPDESTRKSGKDLANSSKWLLKKANEMAAWGECQGSGSKPYQTAIDLTEIAFKCSCPSRKFPCKHGIALGVLISRDPSLQSGDQNAPDWVTDWIDKRTNKTERKTEIKNKPVDEAAQAKRLAAREQKVSDGMEEILRWVKDIIRDGLLKVPGRPFVYWESMARRMVDAQAPGLAGMIKNLGSINFIWEGWQSQFLDALLNIYLLAKSYQNIENVAAEVQAEIRNLIGFTINQEELKSQNGLLDNWLVVGKQVSDEDNLVVERNWLYGTRSGQFALILQFNINGQGLNLHLTPGISIEAELVYFPAVSPLRALIKNQSASASGAKINFHPSWLEVLKADSCRFTNFPINNDRPYAVSAITPVSNKGRWWLKDHDGNLVALKDEFNSLWKLLALGGGDPLDMIVIGKGSTWQPLGVWTNGTYKAF